MVKSRIAISQLRQATIPHSLLFIVLHSSAKKKKKDHRVGGRRGIGVFAFGEDTHALRLTSELVDLRSGYANPAPRKRLGARVRETIPMPKERKTDHRMMVGNRGIRTMCEDFFALPLTSKLDALCGSNANPVPCYARRCGENRLFPCQNEKKHRFLRCFVLAGE